MSDIEELRQLLQQRAKKQERDESGKFKKLGVWDIAKKYGLSTDDLRVRALASEENVEDPEKAVLKLAAQIHYTKPSDADRPGFIAKGISFGTLQERLMDEYQAGAKNLRGNALINWKMKMRKRGLEIS